MPPWPLATRLHSIGCGVGLLEALLQAEGVVLTGVDVDHLDDPFDYETTPTFLDDVRRIRPPCLFDIKGARVRADAHVHAEHGNGRRGRAAA